MRVTAGSSDSDSRASSLIYMQPIDVLLLVGCRAERASTDCPAADTS